MNKEEMDQHLEQKLPKTKEFTESLSKVDENDIDKVNRTISDKVEVASEVYGEMSKFIATQLVNNVELIKQPILEIVSWKDVINNKYRIEYFPIADDDSTADKTLPAGNTTIDDFNAPDAEPFTVYYDVSKQIYQKRTFSNEQLFDMFKNGGGLSTIVKNETRNIKNVISRRQAGDLYTLLVDAETSNETIGTKGLQTIQTAKLIRSTTTKLETPSKTRIEYEVNSKKYNFEHQANSEDLILILNKTYENDKAFDVDGTKFGPSQFNINYSRIMRLDFNEIATQYSLPEFEQLDALLIEKGAIMGAMIYNMASILRKPRFKVLREWAMRYGFDKKGDRYVAKFNNTIDPTETPSEITQKVEAKVES